MHIKYGFGLKKSVKRVRRIDIDHLWNMANKKYIHQYILESMHEWVKE